MVFSWTMEKLLLAAATAALLSASTPSLAGASGFALVNQAGAGLSGVEVRRTGSADWRPLAPALSPGARTQVAFSDPDCAFDVKARLAGNGEALWRGVNLCEVKSVTLNRGASGETWVDYD